MDSSGRKEKDRKKETLREKFKKEPFLIVTYFLLRMIVIVVMVLQARNGNYKNVFLCLLTLLLFTVPSFIEHRLKIDIPNTLEIIVLIFIFSAEILGEIRSYYTLYKGWDTALHTITGFLTATLGFSLVDLLNRISSSVRLSPLFVCLFSICFSMTIGVLLEFFESAMDYFFLTDMQKDSIINSIHSVTLDSESLNRVVHIWDISEVDVNGVSLGLGGYLDIGLYDTIKDLAVTFLGSVIYSFFGFFYLVGKSDGSFLRRFMPVKKNVNGEEE